MSYNDTMVIVAVVLGVIALYAFHNWLFNIEEWESNHLGRRTALDKIEKMRRADKEQEKRRQKAIRREQAQTQRKEALVRVRQWFLS